MNPLRISLLVAAMAFSLPAVAQQNAPTQQEKAAPMTQKPASMPQDNTGAAPSNNNAGASTEQWGASASPETQPEMATGSDLKGPPMRFPANKTPE